jgi:hypothetical protein
MSDGSKTAGEKGAVPDERISGTNQSRSFQRRDIHRRPASKGARDGTMSCPTAPAEKNTTFRNTFYQQATSNAGI